MNWKLKARVQNFIALLPSSTSYKVYYFLQRNFGGLRKSSPLSRLEAGFKVAELIRKQNRSLSSKTFLEIGTGHQLNLPIALWLCGASRIVTVDLNPYLKYDLVKEDIAYIRDNFGTLVERFSGFSEHPVFINRLEKLVNWTGESLLDLLGFLNIQYMAPADAGHMDIAANSIDYHVSYAVLEHIPPSTISQILYEAKRVLKKEGLFVHCVDFSDHFSHADSRISAINFLQFSENEWSRFAGNRYMYQNRLRIDDFIGLLKNSDLSILSQEAKVDSGSVEVLNAGFALDEKFCGKSVEVNATASAWVVASR